MVEREYHAYAAMLDGACQALRARLVSAGGDAKPPACTGPEPLPWGYDLLPRFVPDPPMPGETPRAQSNVFSWPRTATLVAAERIKVDALVAALELTAPAPAEVERSGDVELVGTYAALAATQRTIDAQIKYNRIWQQNVADDRPRFDRQTVLHDIILELQALADAGRTFGTREAALARDIQTYADELAPAPFVRVRETQPGYWVVRVPLYTDISDDVFLRAVRTAIQEVWHLDDGSDHFRVKLAVRRLPTVRVPLRGEHVDVPRHVADFPSGGGVLTTGAQSTYAVAGRFIALGPNDIAPHVLAHEFGHILGFNDVYLRGYHDLGDNGFEVLEAIPPATDIMGAPGYGPVRRRHFERLIARAQPPA